MILKSVASIGLGVLVALTAATSGFAQTVKIGSKNFTEQFVVAEIYAQALEKAGITVERRLNLGATLIAHSALTSGEIDLYPEYTGTALAAVVKGDLSGSADKIYKDVKDYYEKNLQLTLLEPTQINNGYAIITLPETAEKYKLKTLTDLGPASKELSFGAEGGFGERKDGLPGLKQVYGIEFKDFRIFAKLGIRYSALTSKNIDVSYGFSTDWQIADSGLVVLDDDKHLVPSLLPRACRASGCLGEEPEDRGSAQQGQPAFDQRDHARPECGRRTRQEGTKGSRCRVPERKRYLIILGGTGGFRRSFERVWRRWPHLRYFIAEATMQAGRYP